MGDSLKWCAEHEEELREEKMNATRDAAMHMTMAYGAPSVPYEPPHTIPLPFVPLVPPSTPTVDWEKVLKSANEREKHKLRITTRREENGELKLKVYVDGELVYEAVSEGGGTLTVETTV